MFKIYIKSGPETIMCKNVTEQEYRAHLRSELRGSVEEHNLERYIDFQINEIKKQASTEGHAHLPTDSIQT